MKQLKKLEEKLSLLVSAHVALRDELALYKDESEQLREKSEQLQQQVVMLEAALQEEKNRTVSEQESLSSSIDAMLLKLEDSTTERSA